MHIIVERGSVSIPYFKAKYLFQWCRRHSFSMTVIVVLVMQHQPLNLLYKKQLRSCETKTGLQTTAKHIVETAVRTVLGFRFLVKTIRKLYSLGCGLLTASNPSSKGASKQKQDKVSVFGSSRRNQSKTALRWLWTA
jgi:hypothetical protein